MKKINLAITGCMGRMGQQLIKSALKDKSIKLVTLTENILINKKICGIKPELPDRMSDLFERTEMLEKVPNDICKIKEVIIKGIIFMYFDIKYF